MSVFRGWLGEKFTTLGMWITLDTKVYRRFHDVIVPAANGTTQIDHLIISPFGLFVVETKNYKGWIFGSADRAKWTQSLFGKKYSFQNPLFQNYRHTKCLADYLCIDHSIIHSIVWFIGESTFKTPMPPNVLDRGLPSYIRSFNTRLLSDGEIERILALTANLKADPSLTSKNHVSSLRERHTSTTSCPKCGAALVERIAKKGSNAGSSFLGCSAYPRCRFIIPPPHHAAPYYRRPSPNRGPT